MARSLGASAEDGAIAAEESDVAAESEVDGDWERVKNGEIIPSEFKNELETLANLDANRRYPH